MQFTKEAMAERAEELRQQIATIEATSAPLREERDAYSAQVQTNLAQMNARISDAEVGLFDIKQEYALLIRATGARTLQG